MRAWLAENGWAGVREAASILLPVFLTPWRNRPIRPHR